MEWIERWNRAMDEIELSLTGEIDCEPVSYTHLDVYKRQRQYSAVTIFLWRTAHNLFE